MFEASRDWRDTKHVIGARQFGKTGLKVKVKVKVDPSFPFRRGFRADYFRAGPVGQNLASELFTSPKFDCVGGILMNIRAVTVAALLLDSYEFTTGKKAGGRHCLSIISAVRSS